MVKKRQRYYREEGAAYAVMNMENLSYEEAMERLEKIVDELENGKLSLDESVKQFEEGIQLSKYCNDIIEKAEQQISILIQKENGDIVEEKFDTND